MIQQEAESVSFLQENILLIGMMALAMFGYAILIIRKRLKKKFMH